MIAMAINPYALYVHCDGAMNLDSKNTGGVGLEIIFPDSLNRESIKKSIGRFEGANIERLELEAILRGMRELLMLFAKDRKELKEINTIIFITDRYGLRDEGKTNPYKIAIYRKNKWHNHEGKAIKNSDLLDEIDKTRKKIVSEYNCSLEIKYTSRKNNRSADKLAKSGKTKSSVDRIIIKNGVKIGRRKFDGGEVRYNLLKEGQELIVHVFMKDLVKEQWELSAEICEGEYLGERLKIYTDFELERNIHRHHIYNVKIKKIFSHHIQIERGINESNDEK